jgi:DNA-binding NarL/FixJ family response regulator
VKILLADDFEPMRSQVRALLESKIECVTVIEACDGLEAVQQAEELRPEVVILDLSMPRLNGIEAARKIRRLSPDSRIVFFSENMDEDIVRAALATGAASYVLKREMMTRLVPAIRAALARHS